MIYYYVLMQLFTSKVVPLLLIKCVKLLNSDRAYLFIVVANPNPHEQQPSIISWQLDRFTRESTASDQVLSRTRQWLRARALLPTTKNPICLFRFFWFSLLLFYWAFHRARGASSNPLTSHFPESTRSR
jgi:hypothetical protein